MKPQAPRGKGRRGLKSGSVREKRRGGSTDDSREFTITDALRKLPLCDELYLGMQAMNLDVIDGFIEQEEGHLLKEYMETERTPIPLTLFVSALSQMWVFALYEFLRTWRQRAREILRWAKEVDRIPVADRGNKLAAKKQEIEARAADPSGAIVFYWPAYQQAIDEPVFVESLRKSVDKTERLFRRIEALRMSLAKHEMPGQRGSHAMAPGYGRIDMTNGSIYWQVVLIGNEIDIVSRRRIADDCRALARPRDVLILSEDIQGKVKGLPDDSYGVKRVTVILEDGSSYGGVYVAWAKEVVFVEGHDEVPFDVGLIRDVRSDPCAAEESMGSD